MSNYKLFLDENKTFTCAVNVMGASLKNCEARIVLETNNLNLLYKGKITENGQCSVNIPKLQNLFESETKGKIKLEVIAEGTLFTPWESDFTVEQKKKVSITEMVEPVEEEIKKVSITIMEELDIPLLESHIKKINTLIGKNNLKSKATINEIVSTYNNILVQRNNGLNEQELKYIIKNLK